ncbi:FG-GAP-like repeat-containing protein [Aureisphaera galaxeae]|uniref:FG-GAP-like repeat-containing protein n=1 Tax=Aureisphaera galaxeae TaxID=1538023 RepID=UPI002350FB70|nr:FG-GAP-like repeat-containing protein [Aureisphaera galaxeae]MDC8004930.1 FG-GAP-like repeat-containing protein [Aureisphaera galaxeae]
MRVHYIFIFLLLTFFPLSAQIQFQENTTALGLNNVNYGDGFLGGGISFFDFDDDGWDDITVSTGDGYPIRFFKNFGGTFQELFFLTDDPHYQNKTVVWVDFDNDADYDLYITGNTDSNRLYENTGNMNFVDITVAAGLMTDDHRTFGGSWGDYNKDGLLDLFASSRNTEDLTVPNILYRNNGDGTFTDVSSAAGISDVNHYSFCSAFFDYNNDGWQDIVIANDKDPKNLLYHNNGDGTFTEVGEETNTNVVMDAMSTTIGDPNKDGWQDFYVTNTQAGNAFFENNGDGTFTDIASTNGTLFESVGWGAVFLDADNDRDEDLYVSGVLDGSTGMLPSAFYENDGAGNYTIPTDAGFENDTAQSFGNAIGDIDNDGYADIIVLNYAPDNIFLWQNNCPANNNWFKVKLQGTESNRMGIGSTIEIMVDGQKQYNYTLCGEGYLGQNSAYEFFGLGTATEIEYVKVTWLSGIVDYIENPTINEAITIIEGSTLGTETFQQESRVTISPNPVTNQALLKTGSFWRDATVEISDIQGRTLWTAQISSEETTLNFSRYPSGVYFVKGTNGQRTFSERIVLDK